MRYPPFLELRIKELNLGLAPAQPAQIWVLTEPPARPRRFGIPSTALEEDGLNRPEDQRAGNTIFAVARDAVE